MPLFSDSLVISVIAGNSDLIHLFRTDAGRGSRGQGLILFDLMIFTISISEMGMKFSRWHPAVDFVATLGVEVKYVLSWRTLSSKNCENFCAISDFDR